MRSRGWSTPEWSSATRPEYRPTHQRSARSPSAVPLHLPTVHGLRMPQQTSAEAEQDCTSAAMSTADAPDMPRPEQQTALACLARVAAHHGVDLPVQRLRHAYAVDGSPVSQTLLLRMAKEAGLRARTTRLDWGTLFQLGEAYPALVRLANGNWIIVSGAGEGPGGEEQVSVIDPLAERQYEPLVVGKDCFCANWLGDAILIKRNRAPSGSQQSFGFRWFIPEL